MLNQVTSKGFQQIVRPNAAGPVAGRVFDLDNSSEEQCRSNVEKEYKSRKEIERKERKHMKRISKG
jgi:hypothetical protein